MVKLAVVGKIVNLMAIIPDMNVMVGMWVTESGNNQYIFVTNLTDKAKPAADKSLFGGEDAKKATVSLLNSYFN